MPSQYLQSSEYVAYGLPTGTTAAQVTQASLLIDTYLGRKEGLVWGADYSGLPCYMLGVTPSLSFTSPQAITAAPTSVVVTLDKPVTLTDDFIGEVAVLDRGNANLCEACVVSQVGPTPGQITLKSVAQNHAAGCTLDFGMSILEDRALPSKRSLISVSQPPVRLLSGLGRYGYGRRTDQTAGMFNEVNLLAAIQVFGGPPEWVPFDVNAASLSIGTREIWIPAGELLAYYSDARVRYISGWQQSALPSSIKQACANIISAITAQSGLQANLKTFKTGPTEITRFSASMIDMDTRAMINMYRAVSVY